MRPVAISWGCFVPPVATDLLGKECVGSKVTTNVEERRVGECEEKRDREAVRKVQEKLLTPFDWLMVNLRPNRTVMHNTRGDEESGTATSQNRLKLHDCSHDVLLISAMEGTFTRLLSYRRQIRHYLMCNDVVCYQHGTSGTIETMNRDQCYAEYLRALQNR